jgi:hypothetical protein
VRLVLVAAYEQLGHRAGMIRCLLVSAEPTAGLGDVHSTGRLSSECISRGVKDVQSATREVSAGVLPTRFGTGAACNVGPVR